MAIRSVINQGVMIGTKPEIAQHYRSLHGWSRKKAWTKAYRATKRRATPNWLTLDQYIEMSRIYGQAKYLTRTTQRKWTVDHIVPLNGIDVCGLHVPWNLQVLTERENSKKRGLA